MTPLEPGETKKFTWKLGYPGRPYPAGHYRVGTKGVYAEFEVIANMLSAPSDVLILKTDKVSYARGEGVKMTFTNGGNETIRFRQMPPFIIKNQQGAVVAPALLQDVILELLPGGSFSWTWDQLNRFLDPPRPVPVGNYTVTVEVYNSTWGLIATFSRNFEIWEIELSQAEVMISEHQAVQTGRDFLDGIGYTTGKVLFIELEEKAPNFYWHDLARLVKPDIQGLTLCWVVRFEQAYRPGHFFEVWIEAYTGVVIGGMQCR